MSGLMTAHSFKLPLSKIGRNHSHSDTYNNYVSKVTPLPEPERRAFMLRVGLI